MMSNFEGQRSTVTLELARAVTLRVDMGDVKTPRYRAYPYSTLCSHYSPSAGCLSPLTRRAGWELRFRRPARACTIVLLSRLRGAPRSGAFPGVPEGHLHGRISRSRGQTERLRGQRPSSGGAALEPQGEGHLPREPHVLPRLGQDHHAPAHRARALARALHRGHGGRHRLRRRRGGRLDHGRADDPAPHRRHVPPRRRHVLAGARGSRRR